MTKSDTIKTKDLEKFLDELESWLSEEVRAADRKASSDGASDYFREEMKGCARGKSMMGHELISKIRKRFLEK